METREAIGEALGKMTEPELRYVLQRCIGIRYGPMTTRDFYERFPELREPERVKSEEEQGVLEAHAASLDLLAKARAAYGSALADVETAKGKRGGFDATGNAMGGSKLESQNAEVRRLAHIAAERQETVRDAGELEVAVRPHKAAERARKLEAARAAALRERELTKELIGA